MSALFEMLRKRVSPQSAQDEPPSTSPGPTDRQSKCATPSLSLLTVLMRPQDEDDQWSDMTTSEGDRSPTKDVQVDGGLDTYESLEEDSARFLPYSTSSFTAANRTALTRTVPSLFGSDLPPCGLHAQVAYEHVNTRLRKRWLFFRGEKSVSEICQVVKDDLDNQQYLFPAFSRPKETGMPKRQRTPWRSETVFAYEVQWIEYFLREAQAIKPMTESELIIQAKQTSIPKELDLRCERKDVQALWGAWHAKKRAPSPMMPGGEVGRALKAVMEEVVKVADGDVKNPVASGLLGDSAVVVDDEETKEHMQQGVRARVNSFATAVRD